MPLWSCCPGFPLRALWVNVLVRLPLNEHSPYQSPTITSFTYCNENKDWHIQTVFLGSGNALTLCIIKFRDSQISSPTPINAPFQKHISHYRCLQVWRRSVVYCLVNRFFFLPICSASLHNNNNGGLGGGGDEKSCKTSHLLFQA